MREKVKAVLRGNEQIRDQFLSQMSWVEKEKKRYVCDKDITVAIQTKKTGATKDSHKAVCFSIRNGVEQNITSTEYMQICVHKNRIFFREADRDMGYKVYKPSTGNNRYCKMTLLDVLACFVGDYDLKYDDFLELYYIEKEI